MSKIVSKLALQSSISGIPSNKIEGFIVRRGLEGPQIIIKWGEIPFSFSRIILIRKKNTYPISITDGLVLLDESPPESREYVDLDLDILIGWYYQLFYYDGSWQTDNALRGYAFTCQTGFFHEKIWDLLPKIYHKEDLISNQEILSPESDPLFDNEIRKLNENDIRSYGEFNRFLKIFACMFDDMRCLIRFMPNLWDVDNTLPLYLPLLADLLGLEFNYELSVERQRTEIRYAVNMYKKRGTIPGIKIFIKRITNFNVVVDEGGKYSFVTNDLDSTTLDLNEISDITKMWWLENDINSYVIGLHENYFSGYDALNIIFELGSTDIFLKEYIVKLNRLISEWSPYDCHPTFFLIDKASNSQLSKFERESLHVIQKKNLLESEGGMLVNVNSFVDSIFYTNQLNSFTLPFNLINYSRKFTFFNDPIKYITHLDNNGMAGFDIQIVQIFAYENEPLSKEYLIGIRNDIQAALPSGMAVFIVIEEIPVIDIISNPVENSNS